MSDTNGNGFTVKELVVQLSTDVRALDAKIDAYIAVHQIQHVTEMEKAAIARSDLQATAVGRAISLKLALVDDHERAIQRLNGATVLASSLGLGSLILVGLRIAHLIP